MDLKEALENCLSGDYSQGECRFIIDRAHTIGLAYLRMKAASGHLYLCNGEPLEDLAWDFIADLFERNHNNSFIILNSAFCDVNLETASAETIEEKFRRVLITKIDDNIFRSNGEKDPSLKKIIRNLKNAVQNTAFERRVKAENGFISIVDDSIDQQMPLIAVSEVLEIQLCHRIRETMQTPEVLLQVVEILDEFKFYQKKISLVAVAICIRKSFVHIRDKDSEFNQGTEPEENLHRQSFDAKILRVSEKIKRESWKEICK